MPCCLLPADLFFPTTIHEQRCAQLRAARAAVLPAVLSGTHTSGSTSAVQDLLLGLLQADPARRPTVHALLRSGLVADAFRLVAQLPHWRVLAAAPAASTAAAPKAAAPKAAPAAPAPGGPVDHEAVRHFLLLLRKSKQQEFVQAQAQLAALESDLGEVAARRRSRSSSADGARGGGEAPGSKRPRMSMEAEAAESESEDVPLALMGLSEEQQARLAAAMPQLEEVFFQRRQVLAAGETAPPPVPQAAAVPAAPVPAVPQAAAAAAEAASGTCRALLHLDSFARDLNELAAHSRLGLKATLRSGDLASPVEMVSRLAACGRAQCMARAVRRALVQLARLAGGGRTLTLHACMPAPPPPPPALDLSHEHLPLAFPLSAGLLRRL